MKKILFCLLFVLSAVSTYCQLSVKMGYGPDLVSQIGDNPYELFGQVNYELSPSIAMGIGYRRFNGVQNDQLLGYTRISDVLEIQGGESANLSSDEVFVGLWYMFKNIELGISVGYARFYPDPTLRLRLVDRVTQNTVMDNSYAKIYDSTDNFRAGIDLSYNIRVFENLYLAPYVRYHRDFRDLSIRFDLLSMDAVDPVFNDVPEVAAFNADGQSFFVRRAIATFGLGIKYEF